jgi:nitroreductase
VQICAIAKKTYTHNNKENRRYMHDLGAATVYMFLEARNQGLARHVIGGFDVKKAKQIFGIPDGIEPATMIAIGYYGDPETLPEKAREKELAPGSRKQWRNGYFQINGDLAPFRPPLSRAHHRRP